MCVCVCVCVCVRVSVCVQLTNTRAWHVQKKKTADDKKKCKTPAPANAFALLGYVLVILVAVEGGVVAIVAVVPRSLHRALVSFVKHMVCLLCHNISTSYSEHTAAECGHVCYPHYHSYYFNRIDSNPFQCQNISTSYLEHTAAVRGVQTGGIRAPFLHLKFNSF